MSYPGQLFPLQKKGSACVSGVLPVQVVQRCLFVHLLKTVWLFWDRQQTSDRWFVRSMPTHRTTTDEPEADDASSDIVHVHRKFRQIEWKERPTWGADHLLMSFDSDVVSLVYRTELVESVNRSECTRGAVSLPRHCSVPWIWRPRQAAAGKILMNEIEGGKCTVLSWF